LRKERLETEWMHRIIDIISLSAEYLKAHGVAQPRLNAELLLADVLDKSRIELYLDYDKPLTERELSVLRNLLKARATRKPIQYILGKTEFFSLPFLISESVFIPRPETEILVQEVVNSLKGVSGEEEIVVFDVGTGCGCIAVSVAHSIENCRVYASDISSEAVSLARRNAEKNGVAERVILLQGDVFEPFLECGAPKADVMVSNPPYVAEEDWDSLPEEVRCFEPRDSLVAGRGGLDLLRKLTSSAELFLKPGGSIFLEIGEGQKDAVVRSFEAREKFMDIRTRQDYNRIERVVSATLSPAEE
jgi:release factor glutamine methyltransferase